MRAVGLVAIFPTVEEANRADLFTKTFHKFLEVLEDEGVTVREVLITVGQGDEARIIMHLILVHIADSPLKGPLKAAPDTLTARDSHGGITLSELELHRKTISLTMPPAVQWPVARHWCQSRMPPRMGPELKFLDLTLDPRRKFLRDFLRLIFIRLGIGS